MTERRLVFAAVRVFGFYLASTALSKRGSCSSAFYRSFHKIDMRIRCLKMCFT